MSAKTYLMASFALLASLAMPAAAEAEDLNLSLPAGYAVGSIQGLPAPAWLPAATPAPSVEVETTVFGLPKNMGTVDRVARGVIAAALIGLGTWAVVSDDVSDTTGAALLSASAVPIATGATGYCPLYHLLGIDTL